MSPDVGAMFLEGQQEKCGVTVEQHPSISARIQEQTSASMLSKPVCARSRMSALGGATAKVEVAGLAPVDLEVSAPKAVTSS